MGAAARGRVRHEKEPLDMEAEDAMTLEAAARQHMEIRGLSTTLCFRSDF